MYAYSNTVFQQLLHFLPKDRFDRFVGQHGADRYVKTLTTWNQLVVLLYAQATGKESLREIETGLAMNQGIWYHLDIKSAARSTIARANEKRDYRIYESLFYELLTQCKEVTPANQFSFKNALYALDATTISLCLSVFDWATYGKTKGALKLHTLLNVRTAIPEIITATTGKTTDITAGKRMDFSSLPKGSIVVFDR